MKNYPVCNELNVLLTNLPIHCKSALILYPDIQLHSYDPGGVLEQVLRVSLHGLVRVVHSSISSVQVVPSQPPLHVHVPSTLSHDCVFAASHKQVCEQSLP